MVAPTHLNVTSWYITCLVLFIMQYYTLYPNTGITYNALSGKFARHECINERLCLMVQLSVEVAEPLVGF
jgi:hypothetical protein